MKGNRGMILKRIGAIVLCVVFMICMIAPVVASAQENEEVQQRALAYIQLSMGDGQETPVFKAGQKVPKLEIKVKNNGNVDAQNVRVEPEIVSDTDWPFEMSQMNYAKDLSTIKSKEQASAVWGSEKEPLKVREDVSGKSYKLQFKISYDDGEKAYETVKYVFVKTEAKEKPSEEGKEPAPAPKPEENAGSKGDEGASDGGSMTGGFVNSEPVISGGGSETASTSVPRVIVTGFSTEPAEVRAGSNFKLIVHLKNTSTKTAVSNMLFDMQAPAAGSDAAAEAPAFLPASGSSSIYLDRIAAGGTSDISIDLNARADLVQKPYSIAMSMKYEDSVGTQFDAQSSLAIPVKQEARFEFSKIEIAPETIAVGEEANISCSLYNLGRVKMYNVKARFEGPMIDSQEQFIGNLESGATGMIDAIVTATQETMDSAECKLILTYEDDAGNVSKAEETFTLAVTPPMAAEDMGMVEMQDENSGFPFGLIIGIVVVILAVIVIVTVILVKRKKNRQEIEEEELFDEVERSAEDEH